LAVAVECPNLLDLFYEHHQKLYKLLEDPPGYDPENHPILGYSSGLRSRYFEGMLSCCDHLPQYEQEIKEFLLEIIIKKAKKLEAKTHIDYSDDDALMITFLYKAVQNYSGNCVDEILKALMVHHKKGTGKIEEAAEN
jgi:hypothetical protein